MALRDKLVVAVARRRTRGSIATFNAAVQEHLCGSTAVQPPSGFGAPQVVQTCCSGTPSHPQHCYV